MARLHQVFRHRPRIDRRLHGARAICCADAGGHARRRFDGHRERSGENAAVARHHLFQPEAFTVLVGQRQADQPACFASHETDRLGCAAIGGEQQVTFVFTVFIIDQQHHLALAVVFNDVFDAIECHAHDPGFMDE